MQEVVAFLILCVAGGGIERELDPQVGDIVVFEQVDDSFRLLRDAVVGKGLRQSCLLSIFPYKRLHLCH